MLRSGPEVVFLEDNSELIAEQLRHTIDLLRAEIKEIRADQIHEKNLFEHRIKLLEKSDEDHETRLRSLQEGVTSFKVWSGLANGGAGLISLFALLRTMLLGG